MCATFRSCAAPLPSCPLPPLAHPPPLPTPGSTLDPSTLFLHPHSARAQHSSPRLCLALLTHPLRLHCLLPGLHHPSFCAPSPHAQSSTDAWLPVHGPIARGPPLPRALLACGTLCMAHPLCAPPSLLHFQHARKRVCGHGAQTEGEEVQPGWRGPPQMGRGDTVPCASSACVQRGRGAGEVR